MAIYMIVLIAFSLVVDASLESTLTIDPPGPVVVFNSNIRVICNEDDECHDHDDEEHFESIILTCKSTRHYNITWDIPDLNFAELADQKVIRFYIFKFGSQAKLCPNTNEKTVSIKVKTIQ